MPPQLKQSSKFLLPMATVAAIIGLVAWAASLPAGHSWTASSTPPSNDLDAAVARVDQLFEARWVAEGLDPAQPADELQVLRRLSLALDGTIPSLEEIRLFEADRASDRLRRWTDKLLADPRFGDYFAQRLTRSLIANPRDDFPGFRREHFVAWLSEQLQSGQPYDEIARQIISQRGLPTSYPATNFVTSEMVEGDEFEFRLAGRTVRAFLGQRIDCAQCHDHPFDDWKQADFEGLAGYFGQAKLSAIGGVQDDRHRQLVIEDRMSSTERAIASRVPFHNEWLPGRGAVREQLAAWVTHPENRRFQRAVANRVWGLMFGRPFVAPIDDIPDPSAPGATDETQLLDILGADLQAHGYDVRRMIQVIAASRPFRLASTHPMLEADQSCEQLESEYAVFPLERLRPEQFIGAMQQASSIKPIDRNSTFVSRTKRYHWSKEFVAEYADVSDTDLDEQPDTIPQALLRMNGKYARQMSGVNVKSAPGRIALMAADDASCLDTCYLVCLTRRPTPDEQSHFLTQLQRVGRNEKQRIVEDIFWTLFNSPEFSWNH